MHTTLPESVNPAFAIPTRLFEYPITLLDWSAGMSTAAGTVHLTCVTFTESARVFFAKRATQIECHRQLQHRCDYDLFAGVVRGQARLG